MVTVHWFLGQHYAGEGRRADESRYLPAGGARSAAYFCPRCGEIWARTIVTGREYDVYAKLCGKHPSTGYYTVPGSVLLEWDPEFNAGFSQAIVEREFSIHMTHYEKWKERI